jgi:hypothetical protein
MTTPIGLWLARKWVMSGLHQPAGKEAAAADGAAVSGVGGE